MQCNALLTFLFFVSYFGYNYWQCNDGAAFWFIGSQGTSIGTFTHRKWRKHERHWWWRPSRSWRNFGCQFGMAFKTTATFTLFSQFLPSNFQFVEICHPSGKRSPGCLLVHTIFGPLFARFRIRFGRPLFGHLQHHYGTVNIVTSSVTWYTMQNPSQSCQWHLCR